MGQVAQTYSEKCVFAHNPNRTRQAPSFSSVGENLAISIGAGDNYEALFMLWHDEYVDYNFTTNQCSSVCGHYTQVKCISVKRIHHQWRIWGAMGL